MPINRIAQYEHYLRLLADETEESSSDHLDITNAFVVLAKSSLVVQTSLVQSGETAKIQAVQRKLRAEGPLNLVKDGRRFIQEFRFKKEAIFLFTDMLIVAKISQKNAFPGKKEHKGHTKAKEDLSKVKKVAELKNCELHIAGESKKRSQESRLNGN